MSALNHLFEVVSDRRVNPQEGSYTCYLFEKGLDKILKKVGEEAAETIIAAKGGKKDEIVLEICDLLYHLVVLMVEAGVSVEEIEAELTQRSLKIGNLKTFHQTDKNS
ncbi:MAG: phosphoribosyl-ATP diphosphatase [Clostridia bacterium]|nr:phosphoribosyl-ATP diphosphatase [Oscillospiraceae bacterium]MBR6747926.1 phosphoribosyl-ATP diphosphatase [Clostridia bacterium]